MTPPDFTRLKAERDAAIKKIVREAAIKMGADPDTVLFHSCDMHGCYCACPEGPCEHEFAGCREFEDGSGFETFCQKCGLGSMAHDLRHAE